MHITKKRLDQGFIYSIALIPWIYSASIVLFYLHAGLMLGRFPTYANPDPKDLNIYSLYGWIVTPFLLLWAITFLIWLLAFIIYVSTNKSYEWKRPLMLIITGQIVSFLIYLSPIFEWYVD